MIPACDNAPGAARGGEDGAIGDFLSVKFLPNRIGWRLFFIMLPAPERSALSEAKEASGAVFSSSGSREHFEPEGTLNCVASRENFIRNSVQRWFGPQHGVHDGAKPAVFARRDAVLQALLRLHRLSCNLVPEARRIPLHEQDVFTAIIVLNRIGICLRSPMASVIGYCEASTLREQSLRANLLDPLQLRHLLCFHENIPNEQLSPLDIHTLKDACERSDRAGIQSWFEAAGRRSPTLPKDTPQFLRQLVADLWTPGSTGFLDTYASELSILDAALCAEMGWENSRLYFALLKRLHGADCKTGAAYIDASEIALALQQRKALEEADGVVHFRSLATGFDPQRLRRLERAVLAAPHERGSRVHSAETLSPVALKRQVAVPPAYSSSEYYAQKAFQPVNRSRLTV